MNLTTKIGACVLWFLTPTLAYGEVESFVGVEIDSAYEKALLANPSLMKGSVDIVDVPPDGEVMVAVGVVANKTLNDPSPKAWIHTRRVAHANAARAISIYLQTDVTTKSTLKKKVTVETIQTAAEIQRVKRIEKVVSSWTREESKRALRQVKKIGTWYSADRTFFFMAVRVRAVD
jgi:hypothetical protein